MKAVLDRFRRNQYRRRLRDPAFAFMAASCAADEVVSLKLETSAADVKSCAIIAIGAVRLRGNRMLLSQKLDLRVCPLERPAAPARRPRPGEPGDGLDPRVALTQLLRFIGPRPLLGYSLEFDLAVINRQMQHWLGVRLPNRRLDVSGLYNAYKSRGRIGVPVDQGFEAILRDLDLPLMAQRDTLDDAIMAGLIYLKLRELDLGRAGLLERILPAVRGAGSLMRG